MRLQVSKPDFMKSWQTAERVTSTKSTISSLSGILCRVDDTSVILEATDLKTSIKCIATGVNIEESGEAILPVKIVGELFKKAPTFLHTLLKNFHISPQQIMRNFSALLKQKNSLKF